MTEGPIASPLAALVQRARTTLPATTGETARAQARRDTPEKMVILADVSQSMSEQAGSRSKHAILADALGRCDPDIPVLAFASLVDIMQRDPSTGAALLPTPHGGTALHLALQKARDYQPTHILVVSDGHPDNPSRALAEADRLGKVSIDVIYCGPDHDREGVDFMRRLTRHGGQYRHYSATREPERIAAAIRLLAGPR